MPLKLIAVGLLLAGSARAQKTVWGGVYSEAQAQRGEELYQTRCFGCHGVNLEGKPDPSLVGPAFIDRWREDNLSTLFNHISTRMPARAPGSLPQNAYLDALAFILRSNDMPAGAQDLTAESTGSIRLVRKEGAQPLPTNTVVLVVGCFSAGPRDTWTLTRSTEPSRTQDAEETDAGELKRSSNAALATQAFRLQNLDFFKADFQPDSFKDQKVLVKGVLIRQTGNDRINVTAVEKLGARCN